MTNESTGRAAAGSAALAGGTGRVEPPSETVPGGAGRPSLLRRARDAAEMALRRPAAGALAGTVLVYVFFVVATAGNGFLTSDGTATWLNQAAQLSLVAIPVGLLMIAGEFDLSVASVVGVGALTVSIGTAHLELPIVVSICLALIFGATAGLLNGLITVRTKLPSMVVTLASFLILGGAALALTRALTTTTNVNLSTSGFWHSVFAGPIGPFHAVILWALAMLVICGHVLSRTVFGNWIFATGGDVESARTTGVPTDRVKVLLFMASGTGAALLGVVQALEYGGGQVGQGQNFIFDAITAAVIGGVLLTGGYGSAIGIAFGAMTYGIVNTGIFYTGWNADLATVFIGSLVLAAVLANNMLRKRATKG